MSTSKTATSERFIILDGHAIIYRAFYAFPELTDPKGRLVNAVYGFARILLTAIRDFAPKYIAVAFDHKAPTKRSETFADYKAQRAPMPDDMRPQIEIIKDFVLAMNIPQFELAGFEADDLIGTIVEQLGHSPDGGDLSLHDGSSTVLAENLQAIIITGDKDLFQLVDDRTHVFIPGRGRFSKDKEYDQTGVVEKMGVTPSQIVDLKALMGDSSDNIPGVKGVGPKSAVGLIARFGSLDGVYEAVEAVGADAGSGIGAGSASKNAGDHHVDILKGALLEKLRTDKKNAYLSRDLATITRGAPIKFDLSKCVVKDYDKDSVAKIVEELNFQSLVELLPRDEFEQGVQEALF